MTDMTDKEIFVIVKTAENSTHFKPILEKDYTLKLFTEKKEALEYVVKNFPKPEAYLVCSKAQFELIKKNIAEEELNKLNNKVSSYEKNNDELLAKKLGI